MKAISIDDTLIAILPAGGVPEHEAYGQALSTLSYRSSQVHNGAMPRILLVLFFAFASLAFPLESEAAIALVQKATAVNNATNPTNTITATYAATPGADHLLIAIIGAQASVTINQPSGWSTAISESGGVFTTPGQAIFFKTAGAAEPTGVTVTVSAATALGLQIYEYSGTALTAQLDGTASATGNGTLVSSGTLANRPPGNTNDLLIAGLVINIQNATFSLQTNSFVEQADISNLGSPQMSYAGEDRLFSNTNNGTTATSSKTGPWRGQIAAFKSLAPTACTLESFTASRSEDGVMLEWRTGYEIDNIGFNIYRQDQSGQMTRLTPHLVAGSALMVRRGTALTSGLSYSWSDPEAKKGDPVRYWLEDLDVSGQSTWNGPYGIDETRRPGRPSPGRGRSVMIDSLNAQQLSVQAEQNSQYEPTGQLERTAKARKVSVAAQVQAASLAGSPAVKISVKQEGLYRVSQAQLLAAGLSASVDPRKLQLFVDGQQIPMIVQGEKDGKLDVGDAMEFYGLGLDTESTDTHVYWLITGSQLGDRIKQSQGSGGASAAASFPYTVQRKDRLYYFSNIPNGTKENFFGAFIYYQSTDQTLNAAHIAPAVNATLEIAMQGFNVGQHQIGVSVNGAIVGTLTFSDQAYSVSTLTFAQSLLTEGANTVSLVAQAGTNDFSFVDYIRLIYARGYNADTNSLKFTAASGRSVSVSGFSDSKIRVVDVTDPKASQEVIGKVNQDTQGYSITLTAPGTGTRTLLAFADAQVKQAAKVAANKLSTWRQSSNSADLVIIAYGDFTSSLQSLQSLRNSQGLQTQLVDVEDVYDEFNFGNKSPQALKDFLSYARTSWTKAPRYVLLGGTASFDPRNYLAVGETDLVPTLFVQTTHIETASDDALADFDEDGIPEMAVGRLPARTADEASRMVQKVISYDQTPAGGNGVLLVADANSGFNFESNNDQLTPLIPASTTIQDIRRGNDANAKQHLLDALNQGKKVVNYTGHGSVDIWEASLLTTTDAAALTNAQKLSIVVAMTCLNAYYIDERIESLAHALLNAQNGGAVAMWSSSGLTDPGSQAIADRELFRQLFSGASIRLGDATIKAKTAVSDIDVRRTWILIGDPTTMFRQ